MNPVMSLDGIREALAGVEYRPGWEISAYQDEFLGSMLLIVARVPDSYCPGRPIDLGIRSRIPPYESAGQFLRWLLHRLIEAEVHEARETLRWEGELVSDPHKEEAG